LAHFAAASFATPFFAQKLTYGNAMNAGMRSIQFRRSEDDMGGADIYHIFGWIAYSGLYYILCRMFMDYFALKKTF
jgi:hypothetical protein